MRLGLTLNAIDNTLYDAFGQRQVSVIYSAQNQYHVVMEVAPRYWQEPRTLDELYVSTSGANPTGTQQTGLAAGLYSLDDWHGEHGSDDRGGLGPQSRHQLPRGERSHEPPPPAPRSRPRSRRWCRYPLSPTSLRAYAAQRQSPGTVRGFDDFVQSGVRPCAERRSGGDRRRDPAHRYALDRARRLSRVQRRPISNRSRACRCSSARRWSRSTSCWGSSTKASSIRSRSSRRYSLRASAPRWRCGCSTSSSRSSPRSACCC